MIWQRDIRDLYRDMRRRILAETEQYLARCLADPHLAVVIPRVKVGEGSFPPGLSEQFWGEVLGEDPAA